MPERPVQRFVSHRLPQEFRYLHAPMGGANSDWMVGRSDLARRLADRLMYSSGGAFLVTGFRGVGKTTFVRHVVEQIRVGREQYAEVNGPFELVDIWLNLARPIEPVTLMHHLVRHLTLRLKETGHFERLEKSLRQDLETAYLRTTFEISGKSGQSQENGRNLALEPKWLGLEVLGKIGTSHTKTTSAEDALKFLPYDERAAEFDIVSLSHRLSQQALKPPRDQRWWHRVRRVLGLRRHSEDADATALKVVFVLDELDKLDAMDAEQTGTPALDEILETLKTIFTSTAFSFVFIAGKELRARWTREVARGDSIYESVFAADIYLPCLWKEHGDLVDRCFFPEDGSIDTDKLHRIRPVLRFLEYKGRGIPRRLWRELNRHVVWEDGRPTLSLDHEQGRYVRVFAKLQEIADDLMDDLVSKPSIWIDASRYDSQCLTLYYTLDWLSRRGRNPFSANELQEAALGFNLGSEVGAQFPRRLIETLKERSVIEEVSPTRRVVEDGEEPLRYRLAEWAAEALEAVPTEPARSSEEGTVLPDQVRSIGPYRLLETVGEGGFGTVYKVLDTTGTPRALKVMSWRLSQSTDYVRRFEREVEILSALRHPNVVKIHESGRWQDRPYLVMDYVAGLTLREVLDRQRRLDESEAIAIAKELALTLSYLHGEGIVRNDIKPANILLTESGELKLMDFSISKPESEDALTATGAVIGTTGYLAPETALGHPTGAPADVFALGVVLYEMLTGQLAHPSPNLAGYVQSLLSNPPVRPSKLVDVDPALEDLILRALKTEPEARPSARDLANELDDLAPSYDLAELVARPRRSDSESLDGESKPPITAIAEIHAVEEGTPLEGTAETAKGDAEGPLARDLPSSLRSPDSAERKKTMEMLAAVNKPEEHDLLFDFADRLCILTQGGSLQVVAMGISTLVLGRDPTASFHLPNPGISRRHTAFLVDDEGVAVEDLGSSNGTFLNREQITHARLADGDTLQVGTASLRVHLFDEPARDVSSPSSSQPDQSM